jgi:hypothetical protein
VAYDSLGRVGNYTVWARRGAGGDISRPLPVAPVLQGPSAPSDEEVNTASVLATAVFLACLFITYRKLRTWSA